MGSIKGSFEGRAPKRFLYSLLILTAVLLLFTGGLYVHHEEKTWSNQALKSQSVSVAFKARQIEEWRSEMLSDARIIAESPILREAVNNWIEMPGNLELENEIIDRFKIALENDTDYDNIILLDKEGKILLSGKKEVTVVETSTLNLIHEVLNLKKEVFGDLFVCKADSRKYIEIVFPVYNKVNSINSILIFRIDPADNLSSLVHYRPYDNTTEEFFMFEIADDSALILSNLNEKSDAALSLKIPVVSETKPPFFAIQAGKSFFEGTGYRGNKVYVFIQQIDSSPWYLASMIDKSELLKPVYHKTEILWTILLLLFVSLTSGTLVIITNVRKRFYKQLLFAEQKQAALKMHFEYLVKYANDIIFLEDEELNIIEANQRAQQTYQYSLDELRNMKITDLVAPEAKNNIEKNIKEIIENDGAIFESKHQRKDGTTFFIEISSRHINIEGRQFLQQIIRDITERKKYEMALRESEEKFRTALYSTGDAIITTDIFGKINCMNRVAEELTGWKEDEAKGEYITDVFVVLDKHTRKRIEDPVEKVLENKIIILLANDVILKSKDGREIPIGDSGAPIYNSLGEISGVILVFRDITKDIEAQKALQESEHLFNTLATISPVGIFHTNPDGYTTYVNPSWCKMAGISAEKAVGNGWLSAVHPDDRENVLAGWNKAIQNKSVSSSEYRFLRPDGSVVFIIGHAAPEFDSENQIKGYVGTITDITGLKKMEKTLILEKERAEESDRLKTAFLHNISHEIRTPMNAIVGFSSLLGEPDITKEQQASFITTIQQSCDHLLSIISDIVSISNIEAKSVHINVCRTDLNSMLKRLYNQFIPQASDRNISFHYETSLENDKSVIQTDSTKLFEILSNILCNAFKFTSHGEIAFGYILKDQFLEFYISDTGIGIPPDQLTKIFDRFYQVKNDFSRLNEGTGLGLAICKSYVELLGGKIWVTSVPGKGSVFYFTIPYIPASIESSEPESVSRLSKPVFTTNKTILVAEDDEASLRLIVHLLKDINVEIVKACNGKEAVEKCKSNKNIDLVLMDIKMPVMDGYTAAKQIRQFLPDIKIIAQSAYFDDELKAIENGCSDFISKPYVKEQLLSKIREHLGQP